MAEWNGYRITSPFGWRTHPIRGGRDFHTGIDLVKSHRAPIEAFTAGKVIYSGMGRSGTGLGGYGNVVLLEDRYGRGQLYAHLDQVLVVVNQQISRGTVIGRQGATGNVTGSHLHFEVRKRTTPQFGWEADRVNNCLNPTQYINQFDHKDEVNDVVYTVRSGDTLSGIAQRYQTTVEQLVRANQIRNRNLIRVGQQLVINPNGHGNYYIVQRNDNLSIIAQRHRISLNRIKQLNPQVSGPRYIIQPGDRLRVK
ncbi:LysM domain-containing protein [Amphibacillus marinus]|uniref:LysM domain-containing protein n=1 Tax=Amphibacillus marinus TaxID=872970 RepID=A0A1H8SL06_9BACI|nr:M23 family metallopeptidase [Amphibacillus marinus]SEO79044.1 LysM domain-containing protein [Amphibacillus marinus]